MNKHKDRESGRVDTIVIPPGYILINNGGIQKGDLIYDWTVNKWIKLPDSFIDYDVKNFRVCRAV